MSRVKITLFRHISMEGLGSLHQTLVDRNYDITYVTTARTDLTNFDALEPDLLLIMGGPIGVYQADDYPFLHDEIRIIKERIIADKATLGVCLGSQLIAKALGANVYPGSNGKELGWNPLIMTKAAKGTSFEHFAPEHTNMFHWHGDTFDFPEGATLMASSDRYENQAFIYGENICGLQCHPEITKPLLQEWFVSLVGDVTGDNPALPLAKVQANTDQYAAALEIQTKKFFNQWLEERGL